MPFRFKTGKWPYMVKILPISANTAIYSVASIWKLKFSFAEKRNLCGIYHISVGANYKVQLLPDRRVPFQFSPTIPPHGCSCCRSTANGTSSPPQPPILWAPVTASGAKLFRAEAIQGPRWSTSFWCGSWAGGRADGSKWHQRIYKGGQVVVHSAGTICTCTGWGTERSGLCNRWPWEAIAYHFLGQWYTFWKVLLSIFFLLLFWWRMIACLSCKTAKYHVPLVSKMTDNVKIPSLCIPILIYPFVLYDIRVTLFLSLFWCTKWGERWGGKKWIKLFLSMYASFALYPDFEVQKGLFIG